MKPIKCWEVHKFKKPIHPMRMKFDDSSYVKRFSDKTDAFELKWSLEEKDQYYEYQVLEKWK